MFQEYHMDTTLLSISIDLFLIFRVLTGFAWGIAWALYLQFNDYGKFLVEQRTWITVVVGIGLDLIIAAPWFGSHSDWFTVTFVICASAIGIIARSLHNERRYGGLNVRSYKLIWGLEDAIATSGKITEALLKLMETGNLNPDNVKAISKVLAMTHKLTNTLRTARRGDYSQKDSRN